MKTLLTIVLTILGLAVIGTLLAFTGFFEIAANEPDSPIRAATLEFVMERSVKTSASHIVARPLDDEGLVAEGAPHYREMCAQCHGGPGVRPGELASGLSPSPPDLARSAPDWSDSELFWITRNGIRYTGMPAWSSTDSDDELWSVVAFVRKLPKMSAAEYARLTTAPGEEEGEAHGEAHSEPGTHSH